MRSRRLELYICCALVIGILAVYGQVWNHGFINYDDTQYVTKNPWVQEGLTFENISRAFTATEASNWHPLTWLSHMADCQFFGLNPGGHHLTSLLFHIVNTLLLFLVFRMMTGALWPSAFVAALFALHPLHVESVAWVAERKDVLSAFFWLLTMWAYVRYTRRPGVGTYLPVFFFFALGLMSKPMVVTLPFVLMLLDWWPLGRLRREDDRGQWFRLMWEKLPLLVLAAASSVVTFLVQRGGGAVTSLEMASFKIRVANAMVSYVTYLGKMIWPHKLAVFYPHPGMAPLWQIAGAAVLILGISFLVLRVIKKHPYLAVGWLWYLGTLVPMIGLVQVGGQSMADRYTYLPLIGIGIMVAWGVPAVLSRWQCHRAILVGSATPVLAVLMVVTWVQAGYWKDNISLFRRALDVTTRNYLAHNNLGTALGEQGDTEEAIRHFHEALRITHNNFASAHYNLGNALAEQSDTQQAVVHYREVLRIDPDNTNTRNNLGGILETRGDLKGAARCYMEALMISPGKPETRANLSRVLVKAGDPSLASRCYSEVLKSAPVDAELRMNFGVVLSRLGDLDGATRQFREAVQISPENARGRYNLALTLSKRGMLNEAVKEYRASLAIEPENHKARYNLGLALYVTGDYAGAIASFEEVMRREPALEARASYEIARAYAREKKVAASVKWVKRAIDAGYNHWDMIRTDPDLENIRETSYYRSIIRDQGKGSGG